MALFEQIKPSRAATGPEHQAPLLPGSQSAGDALRQQREACRLDLVQVAAALKIKPAYLAAIEEGRTDLLPGAVYAVGFVRAYSRYLGLDSAEILRRFKFEASGFDAKPELTFPMPLGEQSVPGGGMLLLALILTICVYGIWYYWFDAGRMRPERVAEVPPTLLAELQPKQSVAPLPAAPAASPAPGASTAAEPISAPKANAFAAAVELPGGQPPVPMPSKGPNSSNSDPDSAGPGPGPLISASVSPSAPKAAAASAPDAPASPLASPAPIPAASAPSPVLSAANPTEALAPPPPTPDGQSPRIYGPATGPSRILLRATTDSWVQIRDANRTVLFTGLLKPGDSYRVPDLPGLSMRAGNAGGLDIVVDGHPAPALGPAGAVRNVMLDPQALMTEAARHD